MRENKYRFLYMILLGIIISVALNTLLPGKTLRDLTLFDLLISIIITILVWEGNLRIDHLMNLKYPWLKRPGRRIVIHLVLSVGYSGIIIAIASSLYNLLSNSFPVSRSDFFRITMTILGVLVLMSLILLTIEVSTQFFRHWKRSLVEIEKYRTESLQAQLQNLRNQINPHFLFNNLSVLSSLVYKDQDKAVKFIAQLSKVYRYLLDNQDKQLVSLEQEMEFIRSYIFLLQIRFDSNLVIETNLCSTDLALLIPPMALQVLIENAIKHNEISSGHPLSISIGSGDGGLTVANTYRPRTVHEVSSGTGLKNIRSRYRFFTDRQVEAGWSGDLFVVKIPLLSKE